MIVQPEQFTKQIAFNAIPHIDVFLDDGFTRKNGRCQPRPKFSTRRSSLWRIVCAFRFLLAIVRRVYRNRPVNPRRGGAQAPAGCRGCIVVDHRANEGYVTPHEAAGEDAVYISRIRKDPTVDNGLVFWCVSDNLRKGAALNSVQIAELVVERGIPAGKMLSVDWHLFAKQMQLFHQCEITCPSLLAMMRCVILLALPAA